MSDVKNFDAFSDKFIGEYYQQVRGHIREQLTRENIVRYVGEVASMRVVDVGGGDGRDTEWLASLGASVLLIDPTQDMITKAQDRFRSSPYRQSVDIIHGDPQEVLEHVVDEYDLVLSHGVMMYLEDPLAHLRLLRKVVKENGTASVLTKGKYGALSRLYRDKRNDEVSGLLYFDRYFNSYTDTLTVTEESMGDLVSEVGLSISETYGIRILTAGDNTPISELDKDELGQLLEGERIVAKNPSTRGMGQMMHFICEKELEIRGEQQ